MRNAVLPFLSPSYDFGNTSYELEILSENDNIPGFSAHAEEFEVNENSQQSLENCSFAFESSLVTYQSPAAAFPSSAAIFGCDVDSIISSHQQTMLLGKKILAPQLEMDFPSTQNTSKRPIETNEVLPKNGIGGAVGGRGILSLNKPCGENKRSKVTNNGQEWKYQVRQTLIQENKVKVSTRKSQKLTDKITALQKLVSPYGKTDTASVLQEASLYIKLLQEQIQNLFRMLSSSHDHIRNPCLQESGKRRRELVSKGLCLVPISFTEKMTLKEERIDHNKYRYN